MGLATELIFPSGRAAIAQSLAAIGLPSDAFVAVSGHTSDCLTRVARRFGTPLDIRALGPSVRAAIVYEQWGWPLTDDAWTELNTKFKGAVLVLDRVESADFFTHGRGRDLPPGTVEVLSLSKLLGLEGGGLARANGCLVEFEPLPESDSMRRLRNRPPAALAREGYREFFKEGRQAVHPAAVAWLAENCLESAAEGERAARQRHLSAVLSSGLSAGWPVWMLEALANGAGPVWAPVLRGQAARRRWSLMRTLDQDYGVGSASRLFNWSGNPFRPEYEACLALPVHSGVTNFGEILAACSVAA